MNSADLSDLLDETNHDPHESVQAALDGVDGQPHPRVAALAAHLTATKRECWARIAAATGTPAPPDDAGLRRLMTWEVQAARALPPEALRTPVTHAGRTMTVEQLLRLNARHAAWHAGQIAALGEGRPRLA